MQIYKKKYKKMWLNKIMIFLSFFIFIFIIQLPQATQKNI